MSTLKFSNISGFSGDDILMSSPSYLLVSGTLNITGTDSEFSIPAGEFAMLARKLTGVFTFIAVLRSEFNGHHIAQSFLSAKR